MTQNLTRKELFLAEYSKTISPGTHQYLSFFSDVSVIDEFEMLFNKVIENYGNRHFGIYRMCDAEYMYCVGRRMPLNLSSPKKIKYLIKSLLVNIGIVNASGHYILTLDDEYRWHPNFISDAFRILNDNLSIGAVTCWML